MGEETPETETEEETEEIEEYTLVEEKPPTEPPTKPPEKTKIVRPKVEGIDYCPLCKGEELGKDHKKNIYLCFKCGFTYHVET